MRIVVAYDFAILCYNHPVGNVGLVAYDGNGDAANDGRIARDLPGQRLQHALDRCRRYQYRRCTGAVGWFCSSPRATVELGAREHH